MPTASASSVAGRTHRPSVAPRWHPENTFSELHTACAPVALPDNQPRSRLGRQDRQALQRQRRRRPAHYTTGCTPGAAARRPDSSAARRTRPRVVYHGLAFTGPVRLEAEAAARASRKKAMAASARLRGFLAERIEQLSALEAGVATAAGGVGVDAAAQLGRPGELRVKDSKAGAPRPRAEQQHARPPPLLGGLRVGGGGRRGGGGGRLPRDDHLAVARQRRRAEDGHGRAAVGAEPSRARTRSPVAKRADRRCPWQHRRHDAVVECDAELAPGGASA